MTEAAFDYDDLLGGSENAWRSRLIWLGALGVLIAAVATGVWFEFMRGGSAASAQAQTATVSIGNVTKSVSTSGTVAAKSSTNLNFTTTGTGSSRITKVDVTLGQKVKQGDVLMELDPTNTQSALDSAQLSLSIQQSKLTALLQGGTASTLASADQSVVQAQGNYDSAVRALQTLQTPADASTLETAQQAVTSAQAQLQQAKDARAKVDTDHDTAVSAAQSAVTKARNALTAAQQAQTNAEANITTAQATLNSAETTYCALAPFPSPAVSFCPSGATAPVLSGDQSILLGVSGTGTVDQAKAATSVLSTNTSYNNAVSQKDAADNNVTSAENALSDAKDAQATAEAGPAAGQVAVADAAIGSAQAQLDAAQAKLVTVQTGPTQDALAAAQSAITNAAASLKSATAKRDETYAGPLATDVQQQRASVNQAQTAVTTAQQNLQGSKLIAPFDGTVAALNGQAGDLAGSGTSATTAAVVLNTPDQVVLNMTIGETDYNSVKVGQTGTAVFAGIPGRVFPIIIDSIGASPTTTQGVVSYAAQAHFAAGGPGAGLQLGGATGAPGAGGPAAGASGTPGAGGQFGGRRATAAAETATAGGGTPTTPQATGTPTTPQAAGTPTTPQTGGTPSGAPATGGGRQQGGGGAAASTQRPSPGMNATITIITDQRQNVLSVPNAAVTRDGQDRVVQVKQADGSTLKTIVQIGLSDSKNTEITSGVAEGDTVVLPGVAAAGSPTAAPVAARADSAVAQAASAAAAVVAVADGEVAADDPSAQSQQDLPHGRRVRPSAPERRPRHRSGRVRRDRRIVGVRQVDPDECAWLSRSPDPRDVRAGRARRRQAERHPAREGAQPSHRLRLPVVQPALAAAGAGSGRVAADLSRLR